MNIPASWHVDEEQLDSDALRLSLEIVHTIGEDAFNRLDSFREYSPTIENEATEMLPLWTEFLEASKKSGKKLRHGLLREWFSELGFGKESSEILEASYARAQLGRA